MKCGKQQSAQVQRQQRTESNKQYIYSRLKTKLIDKMDKKLKMKQKKNKCIEYWAREMWVFLFAYSFVYLLFSSHFFSFNLLMVAIPALPFLFFSHQLKSLHTHWKTKNKKYNSLNISLKSCRKKATNTMPFHVCMSMYMLAKKNNWIEWNEKISSNIPTTFVFNLLCYTIWRSRKFDWYYWFDYGKISQVNPWVQREIKINTLAA